MKLRIIKRDKMYIPQVYQKTYYSNGWKGFCSPNLKFNDEKLAREFVFLVEKSVPPISRKESAQQVVFCNVVNKNQ